MLAFKSNEKSSTTHRTEGNSMASSAQTVVGKVIPNLLIAEDLLKILRELISLIFTKNLLSILFHGMVGLQNVFISPAK